MFVVIVACHYFGAMCVYVCDADFTEKRAGSTIVKVRIWFYQFLCGSNKYLLPLKYNTANALQIWLCKRFKNHINNIHEIMMISANVHLFIDYRRKIKLTFESAQYATA